MNHFPEHRPDYELPRWQLDEIANAGRENLDVDHVTNYDRNEDAFAGSEVALLTSLGLDEGSTVLISGLELASSRSLPRRGAHGSSPSKSHR